MKINLNRYIEQELNVICNLIENIPLWNRIDFHAFYGESTEMINISEDELYVQWITEIGDEKNAHQRNLISGKKLA